MWWATRLWGKGEELSYYRDAGGENDYNRETFRQLPDWGTREGGKTNELAKRKGTVWGTQLLDKFHYKNEWLLGLSSEATRDWAKLVVAMTRGGDPYVKLELE
ncbi:hypothetical protein BVRB_5g100790 [Beta vulgaris subsp. vulgaris]|nr:hypothetical protein BVRB_5g100790 [Beta vulgaris subsp. vulgaris]